MNEVERRIAKLGAEGILVPEDLDSLNEARLRILELMSDQHWHSRREIITAANGQSEGLRRMRELRELKAVKEIERQRNPYGRDFRYRLVFNTPGETGEQKCLW